MIAAYMAYCVLASSVLMVAGLAFERAARLLRLGTRGTWAGVLALTVVLAISAPFRIDQSRSINVAEAAADGSSDAALVSVSESGLAAGPHALVDEAIGRILKATLPFGSGAWGASLISLWAVLTGALAIGTVLMLVRSGRARRRWPLASVSGECVKVSPRWGPAVVGLLRPEIVVPRWLTSSSESEQRMAVLHEREHMRAGDPRLLAFGYAVALLLPWNPFVWWMHLRLRLAVEMDCDRRVLRHGVPARAYGSFLIDIAENNVGPLLGAAALASSKPILERRLSAMTIPTPRFAVPRAVFVVALGAGAMLAACEAHLPSDIEVPAPDVIAEDSGLQTSVEPRAEEDVQYFVDGAEVEAVEVSALEPSRIASVSVHKGPEGKRIDIELLPEGAAPRAPLREVAESAGAEPSLDRAGLAEPGLAEPEVAAEQEGRVVRASGATEFTGLIVVDGEIADQATMQALDPDRIERVEVIKGPKAQSLYSDPAAARGVIKITTKR